MSAARPDSENSPVADRSRLGQGSQRRNDADDRDAASTVGELPASDRDVHELELLYRLSRLLERSPDLRDVVPPMLEGTVVFSHGYSPTEILRQIRSRRISVLVCVPKVLDVLRARRG